MIQPTHPDAPALVYIFDVGDVVRMLRNFLGSLDVFEEVKKQVTVSQEQGLSEPGGGFPNKESFISYALINAISSSWTMVVDADEDDEIVSNIQQLFRQNLYQRIEASLIELLSEIRPTPEQLERFVGPWNNESNEYACGAYFMRKGNNIYLISLKDQYEEP